MRDLRHLYPLLWRFLPVLDPQADVSFSRDLDSFASEREAAAVREFLQDPNAQVHIMRDHPEHNFAMLGKRNNNTAIFFSEINVFHFFLCFHGK